MPLKHYSVDVSAAGKQAYDAAPNVDVSTAGSKQFIPDFWMVRADSTSTVEAMISFDGTDDSLQIGLPTAAGLGQKWLRIPSHSRKLWVREVGAGGSTCIVHVAPGTNA